MRKLKLIHSHPEPRSLSGPMNRSMFVNGTADGSIGANWRATFERLMVILLFRAARRLS